MDGYSTIAPNKACKHVEMYIYFCDMEYKECLIENTCFPYRLYGYIHASGYGYTLGHIQIIPHSRRKFSLLCCELFNEHLSVFLDMVSIKHNIEL